MDKFLNIIPAGIHYKDQGEGQVILLIHGYLETSEVLSSFAKKLSEKIQSHRCRPSRTRKVSEQ